VKHLEGRAELIGRHENAMETMHEVNVQREAKIKRQLPETSNESYNRYGSEGVR
jgi:hypothetical protein